VSSQRPEPLKALGDRQNEISEPLLCIAATLGREHQLREALRVLYRGAASRPSHEQVWLERIRRAFERQKAEGLPGDRMHTEDLCEALGTINGRTLGILLDEMGFVRTQPEMFRVGSFNRRGYWLVDFQPLFERYLEPESPQLEPAEDDEEVA